MMNYQIPTQGISPYYGQFQQMQNPYMERLQQMQPQQNNILPTQMSGTSFTPLGKIVDSVDIVKATDIPMDSNIYYFPKADGSVIFSKQWMPNGQTRILTFKAVLDENLNILSSEEEKLKIGLSDEVTEIFMNKFDTIVDRLDKLEKSFKPASRTKKEVSADE